MAGCWLLMLLVASCWAVVTPQHVVTDTDSLAIAAFNVRIFGLSKVKNAAVMRILTKIVRRYDIILIQEIRDESGTAIHKLLDQVNEQSPTYAMSISERLGDSSSKEQYAFLYREDSGISLIATYQDPDPADIFQRPPYAVYFKSTRTTPEDIILMSIHTSPPVAVAEINALDPFHAEVVARWNHDDVLIMGDFNADCRYVRKRASSKLKLRSPIYHWWIGNDVDTTTTATDCAYDRLVMSGDSFIASVIPGSAVVFHFDEAYGLNQKQTAAVSDHYPVELRIRTDSPRVGLSTTRDAAKSSAASCVHAGVLHDIFAHFL